MRRTISIVALLLFVSSLSFAQMAHHPDDPVYRDIDRWLRLGLIDELLPGVRPYPLQTIRALLEGVVTRAKGDAALAEEGRRAGLWLDAFVEPGEYRLRASLAGQGALENEENMVEIVPTGMLDFFIGDTITASADFTPIMSTATTSTALSLPFTYTRYTGVVGDTANVGPFNIIQDWDSMAAFGTPEFSFQAGFNRTAAGPFYDDGVVLSPLAPNAGHFSLSLRRGSFSFTALHLALIGRNIKNNGAYLDKHLDYRSYDIALGSRLSVGIFESIVYGERLELMYLVPFSFLFNMQGMTGWSSSTDNSFLGVHGTWRPVDGLAIMGEVYVDDFPFNSFIRFDFNARYKLAGELGLAWSPKTGPLDVFKADYTAVLPYMYTHNEDYVTEQAIESTPNFDVGVYSNYTHLGQGLGAQLLPNSDRFSLRARLCLPFNIVLRPSVTLTRHGNASEGYEGTDGRNIEHTGDYNDTGYVYLDENNYVRLGDTWRFLIQDVIDTRLMAGLGVDWDMALLELGGRELSVTLGVDYLFEYGWNRMAAGGVPVAGNDGITNYLSLSAKISY